MASKYDVPKPIAQPEVEAISPGITFILPWSRQGSGPGLIVLIEAQAGGASLEGGVPSPILKWAEENYCVLQITEEAFEDKSINAFEKARLCLQDQKQCETANGYGLVCYSPKLWECYSVSATGLDWIKAAVCYTDVSKALDTSQSKTPTLQHLAGEYSGRISNTRTQQIFDYADQSSYDFATPHHLAFNYTAEAVSHTRSLTFLKRHMQGPYFDLEAIWDEHTHWEFVDRSVENTMNTMVEEPYVNHIPTLTGGIGRKDLTDFYTNHFIFSNPQDAVLELVSRTVGVDRVVDEFIYKCTHDQTIDWLLPSVPPSGRKLEIPMMAVVNFRGDRLYHEHISWDQGTALKQMGSLPRFMPLIESASDQPDSGGHATAEFEVPVAGKESVDKMRDKNAVESNLMFKHEVRRFN